MEKKDLPLSVRKEVKRLEDVLLPDTYKVPSDALVVDRARRDYFRRDETGSYSGIYESYLRLEEQGSSQGTPQLPISEGQPHNGVSHLPAAKEKLALTKALSRDSLEEYRRKRGLDRLRERLVGEIVDLASFKDGLEYLKEHLEEKRFRTHRKVKPELYMNNDDPLFQEKCFVSRYYPDITADEVSWFSLLKPGNTLLYDKKAPLFYPPGLRDMDVDGLHFSHGTVSERELDNMKAVNSHVIGGITGVDVDVDSEHYPFIHNVAQVMKALLLLKVGDSDLFDRVMRDEDIAPFIRGDALLMRSFSQKSLDDKVELSDHEMDKLRGDITGYLQKCKFQNRSDASYRIHDVIKILGMLSRLPRFVEERIPFQGYAMFYANKVEFVRENGEISDAIPLVDYLQQRIAGQFHDRIVSLDKREELTRELFKELQEKIQEKNLKEGNMMLLDVLQERLLTEFGILVPVQAFTSLRKAKDMADFYIRGSTHETYLERTLKFGFHELVKISDSLQALPRSIVSNVKSIRKSMQEYFDLGVFMSGFMRAGEYDVEGKKIEIFLPEYTPAEESKLEFLFADVMAKSRKERRRVAEDRLNEEMYDHYFDHVLLHEIAESLVCNFRAEHWNNWASLTPDASQVALEERGKYFLTYYATKNPKEDFCETFALYALFGRAFREKAKNAPVVKAKYAFMKELLSFDGVVREFSNKYPHPMHAITGNPTKNWETIEKEVILKQLREEQEAILEERVYFADEALSYSDVENIIDEHEFQGRSIGREEATRIAQKRQQKTLADENEDYLTRQAVYKKVNEVYLREVTEAGMCIDKAEFGFGDFSHVLLDKTKEDAVSYLMREGVKKRRAKHIVERLYPLFTTFEYILREHMPSPEKKKPEEILEKTKVLWSLVEVTKKSKGRSKQD